VGPAYRGAPWRELPERYPPYQTCHRRFPRWTEEGVLDGILRALAEDLKERGGLDLSECFIDGTFSWAPKRGGSGERPSAGQRYEAKLMALADASLVFLSPYMRRALRHTSSPS
jgi:Putative transposase of IS4/5 family (DUF4096)